MTCPVPSEVKVLIRAESESPTRAKVRAGKFNLIIDEPESMGGTDQGPSPIQVLLMALAGCLNVTGHTIAEQRGITVNSMNIKIEGVMNPCNFIGCSFEERAGFQRIQVTIDADVEGATPEEKEAWIRETENRCPVTDNIKADTTIDVVLKH